MPEGFRIAEAFVEVVADDTGLYTSIHTKISRAVANQVISPKMEPDSTGLREKVRAANEKAGADNPIKVPVRPRKDRGALQALQLELDQIAEGIGASWGRGLGLISVGPLITMLNELGAAGGAVLGQIVAGIEDLSGAAALLPSILAAGATAMFTWKLGVQGMGDAMKTANTPAQLKAQQEAMSKLTPSARDMAKALIDLKPIWKDMQKNIQEHLFRDLAADMNTLGLRAIPVMRTEMGEMATSLNLVSKRLLQMAASGPFIADFRDILSNSAQAMFNMGGGLESVMQILRNVIQVGSTFLPELAMGFSEAARNAALFVQEARNTGKLHDWIQTGIDAVRNLWGGLKNVFSILHTLAETARTIMPEMWGGFEGITARVRKFVEEAQRTGKLAEWMHGGMDALKMIGQILANLAATFVAMGDSPVSLLSILVGITGALRWMAENVPILIPMIGALFLAFKVAQTVVSMVQLVGLIQKTTALTKLWAAAQWLLNAAMLANPVGLIVLAVAALVGLAILIITHWTQVKDFFTTLGSWIAKSLSDAFGGFWNWISGLWNDYILPFFTNWGPAILAVLVPFIGIPLLIAQHWDKIKGWLGGIWDWIWGKAVAVWDAITGVISRNKDRALAILGDLGRGALAVMTGGLSELVILVIRKWDDIIGWFKAAPGRIWDAMKNVGNQMLGIGKAIIDGIWNGLKNGWNWLMDKVRNLAKSLFDAAKGALGIGSPSKLFEVGLGRWLPPGVIEGVRKALPAAKAALAEMMRQLVPARSGPLDMGSPAARVRSALQNQWGADQQQAAARTEIGTLVLNIAGNLDPTNAVAWRQAMENLRAGIRNVERSYA